MQNGNLDFSFIVGEKNEAKFDPTSDFYNYSEQFDGGDKGGSQAQKIALEQLPMLARMAKQDKEARERALEAYKDYQQKKATVALLLPEITKGIRGGEDIYQLFLKAVKAISLMTADDFFYEQTEANLIAIYGLGFLHEQPLGEEIRAVEGRLSRLKEASVRPGETAGNINRVKAAIAEHEKRLSVLKELHKKEGGGN